MSDLKPRDESPRSGESTAPPSVAGRGPAERRPFPILGHVAVVALFALAVGLAVAAVYRMFPDDASSIGMLGFLLVFFLALGAAADAVADRFFGSSD